MKELNLKEIQKIELDILCHFKKICDEQKIPFFLSNGTLLGSIKYKGFIPWDDDIDVFVPRKDYDRLIMTYRDSDRYKLYSIERTEKFGYPFGKLCDNSTQKVEDDMETSILLGIDIDIFPLDEWGNSKDAIKKLKKISFYRKCLYYSKITKQSQSDFLIITKIFAIISRFVGDDFWISRINRVAKKSRSFSEYLGCVVWPIYGEKEIIPEKVFSNTIDVEFGGEKFLAPIGYDIYLHSLYGDYEKDLPKEKQKTHHHFKAYQL